jgi:hypothetical protein
METTFMSSSPSSPLERLAAITLSRVLSWLLFVPFVLMLGCMVGTVVAFLFRAIIPELHWMSGLSAGSDILWSVSIGSFIAIIIGIMWMPHILVTDWRWLSVHVLMMSGGVFLTTLSLNEGCEAFPLNWLGPTAGIGALLGVFHWLFLRQETNRAGWWIVVMAISWTLVWLVAVGVGCVLSD